MKKKVTRKTIASVCAAAMALTLAIPSTGYMKGTAVKTEAAVVAEESILDKAIKTINFENGFEAEGLTVESEQRLKLVDGKPQIVSGEYVMEDAVDESGLPEIVEDNQKGKVLKFKDPVKVSRFDKAGSDELDDKYPTGSAVLQTEEYLGGRVKVNENPYHKDGVKETLTDENKDAGISISYWVKVPEVWVETKVKGERINEASKAALEAEKPSNVKVRGANSSLIVFNNDDRVVMHSDDQAKYEACHSYTEDSKEHDMGEQEIVWSEITKKVYVLYRGYGPKIRFNPNYPSITAASEAALKAEELNQGITDEKEKYTVAQGGWYVSTDKADFAKGIKVTSGQGTNTTNICSLVNKGEITAEDKNQYQYYAYKYSPVTNEGCSTDSKIREGKVKGSMQISADNDFGFMEDHFRTDSKTIPGQDKPATKNVAGWICSNPNLTEWYNKYVGLRPGNLFYFDGDEFVTNGKKADSYYDKIDDKRVKVERPAIAGAYKWHYVTVVIENDWVTSYVDGVEAVAKKDYYYCKDAPGDDQIINSLNAKKLFNKGLGITGGDGSLAKSEAGEWREDGTGPGKFANTLSISMLEWLIDADTELYLGGTGWASTALTQGWGSAEGVCLDDISFFATALSKDQAKALYKEVSAKTKIMPKGDVDGDGKLATKDAIKILKHLAGTKMSEEELGRANVDGGKLETKDAIAILKRLAGSDEAAYYKLGETPLFLK